MNNQPEKRTATKRPDDAQQIDLEVVFNILFAGRTTFLFALLVTVGLTALFSIVAPRTYESSVKLMAEPRRENSVQFEIRSYQDRKAFIETVKELLVSKTALSQTIATIEKRPVENVTPYEAEELAEKVLIHTRSTFGRTLTGGDPIGDTNTFFVTVRDSNAKRAAETANALVQSFLDMSNELRVQQAKSATRSLAAGVEDMGKQVKAAHDALVTFEGEAGSLLPELLNIDKENIRIFPELEDLRTEYEQGEVALAELEARADILADVFAETPDGELPALPTFAKESMPGLETVMTRVTELNLKANSLLPFYLDNSRELQNVRYELKLAREELLRQAKTLGKAAKAEADALRATQAARAKSLAGYDERLGRLSRMNSRYQELKRDYEAKARALDSQIQTLAEAQSAAVENFGGLANVTVIDQAVPNPVPVSPKPVRNMLISLLVGLLLGFLAVLFNYYTRPTFVHPRQVEQVTGLPVVGILPEGKSQ